MSALPALATVAQLETRLGLATGTLADLDLARATAALEDASDLVRVESHVEWTVAPGTPAAPPAVVVVVLQVAKRAYNNPNNYASETVSADGASYSYSNNQQALSIDLTDAELRTLRAAAEMATYVPGANKWRGTGSILTSKPDVRGLPAGNWQHWTWRG
jgi:hypothetical protein